MSSSRVPPLYPTQDPVSSPRVMMTKPQKKSEDLEISSDEVLIGTKSDSREVVDLESGPRISSYDKDPIRFNRLLMETRMKVVKAMVYSSFKALEREFELEQQRNAELNEKEQEAVRRNKQNIRRQLMRGQELDEVQTSVVSYDLASSLNAETDLQLAKSMLILVTSVKDSRERYEASLKSRLQPR